jgi:Protein of unknown function (DUF938)
VDGLPFSQSCENNKAPILEVLLRLFADREEVLEIASGTGQHAAWFAGHLPRLRWQPTELEGNLSQLAPRCKKYTGDNLSAPLAVDVSRRPWPLDRLPHALFSANSLHIMPWSSVVDLFTELKARAEHDTVLAVYGPFNYGGQYTSASNAQFDQWLAHRSPYSAIRDYEAVDELAGRAGFKLLEDNALPANNRLLAWHKP